MSDKQPRRKKKNLRARPLNIVENIEDDETKDSVLVGVSEAKFAQKHRGRRTGIDSFRLQTGEIKDEEEKPLAPDTLAIPGVVEPSVPKNLGVQESFHKEVNQKDILQSQMENYVEEELEKRRKGQQRIQQEQAKKNEEKKTF